MDVRSEKNAVPLAVDLDGTLIATDLLWESIFQLFRRNPLYLLLVPFWLARGRAALKQEVARRVDLDAAALPYRKEVLERLHAEHDAGRQLVLATGAPRKFAEKIAQHLGVFDAVLATDANETLTSRNKRAALVATYGEAGFDYYGNSRQDIEIFEAARQAAVVAPDRAAASWQAARNCELIATPKPTARTILKMLRVHQWLKNGLVAVPVVLSHELLNLGMVASCVVAFVSFSAAASAIYIVNDFFDLTLDRRHPTKRQRPFASGLLSMRFGMACFAVLLAISLSAAAFLPPLFLGALLAYFDATTAYSLSVKRMLLLDVLMLAGLYTVRILAGAAATNIDVSFWLLAFSIFFFLSLALVKRYVELRSSILVPGERIAGRGYRAEDQEIIAQAGMASAFSAVLVLALYIDSAAVRELYPHPWMVWPLALLVLYLTMRIWILARRDELHEDPVVFIVSDWRSQIVVLVGAIMLLVASLV